MGLGVRGLTISRKYIEYKDSYIHTKEHTYKDIEVISQLQVMIDDIISLIEKFGK